MLHAFDPSATGIQVAMMWGIFVATYSSIFICSPMLIYLGLRHETTAEPIAPKDQIGGGRRPAKAPA